VLQPDRARAEGAGTAFGLGDGYPRTLEEVGQQFKVTRERIRQIEAKALRKMRHPTRIRSGSWQLGSPLPTPMILPAPSMAKLILFCATGTTRPCASAHGNGEHAHVLAVGVDGCGPA
jgi:hypothetical protein